MEKINATDPRVAAFLKSMEAALAEVGLPPVTCDNVCLLPPPKPYRLETVMYDGREWGEWRRVHLLALAKVILGLPSPDHKQLARRIARAKTFAENVEDFTVDAIYRSAYVDPPKSAFVEFVQAMTSEERATVKARIAAERAPTT
jgi:hypothetical protein